MDKWMDRWMGIWRSEWNGGHDLRRSGTSGLSILLLYDLLYHDAPG